MNRSKTFKLFLISVLTTLLLLGGCRPPENPAASANGKTTSANEAFDQLTQDIFRNYASSDSLTLNYTLKDPSAYEIEPTEATWGEISLTEDDFSEDKSLLQSYLKQLNQIDGLEGRRAVDYDVLKYGLETELEGYDYIYHANNLAPMLGFQSQFPITMAEYHFDDIQDVEDYLTLLSTFDDYIEDILAFENQKAAAGYGMCRSAVEQSIQDCKAFISDPETNLLIEVFPDNLNVFTHLSDEEKSHYIERNRDAVLNVVIPAYQTMIDHLSTQLETAPEKGNLSAYPKGPDYYQYLLKSSVGTDKTPEELVAITERRLSESLFAMSMILANYPTIFEDAANAAYALSDPKEIIEHFKSTFTAEQMPEIPEVRYDLKNVHESMSAHLSPAMYFIPRIDDISNHQIYMNLTENVGNELMPTLAHEGYPGHMYQYIYYYNTNPNPIRTLYSSSGYAEGWAAYIEGLSYDYCGFSKELADFMRLNNSDFMLNLYCRLDLGIHYEGWTKEETSEFLANYLVLDDTIVEEIYNAVLFNPTNYLIYGIGMDEIQELRQEIEDHTGSEFDVKAFHKDLLDLGPAPFPIIRKYMPGTSAAKAE